MIIDMQSHGLHGKYIDQLISAGGDWSKGEVAKVMSGMRHKPYYRDVHLRVEQLEKYGIDLQMVTINNHLDSNNVPGDTPAQLKMAKAINDTMARLMEDSKGRLLAAASVPLVNFEQGGRQEMERAVKMLGLKAVSIVTNLRGKPPDLPEFEPFWAEAVRMDIPVYIHPTNPVGKIDRSYEAQYYLMLTLGWPFETALILSRLVFSGVIERYPSLKILNHHLGGGMIPFFIGRFNETYVPERQEALIGRVLPEPLINYFSRFFYDTVVGESAAAIKCAYDVFGAEQLTFATDMPWGPGTGLSQLADYPKVIRSLGFPDADNKKIFEGNAKRILNMT